jgi:hypothetical protein
VIRKKNRRKMSFFVDETKAKIKSEIKMKNLKARTVIKIEISLAVLFVIIVFQFAGIPQKLV